MEPKNSYIDEGKVRSFLYEVELHTRTQKLNGANIGGTGAISIKIISIIELT